MPPTIIAVFIPIAFIVLKNKDTRNEGVRLEISFFKPGPLFHKCF